MAHNEKSLSPDDYYALRRIIDAAESLSIDADGMKIPKNYEELKRYEKTIQAIKKIDISSETVLELLEAAERNIEEWKKSIPNIRQQLVLASISSVVLVFVVVLVSILPKYKIKSFDYNPNDFVTHQSTFLYANTQKEKLDSFKIEKGTILTPIFRFENHHLLVKTEDGTQGFVLIADLVGGQNAIITQKTPIFLKMGDKQATDTLFENDSIFITEDKLTSPSNAHQYYRKIRYGDHQTGFIQYSFWNVSLPFVANLPKMDAKYVIPVKFDQLKTKYNAASPEKLFQKLGPAWAIFPIDSGYKYYYGHTQYFVEGQKYKGLWLQDNQEGNIAFQVGNPIKKNWLDKFPGSEWMRNIGHFGAMKMTFYENGTWVNRIYNQVNSFLNNQGWILKIVGYVVAFFFGLVLVFMIFSIPRLLVWPITMISGYWTVLSNTAVKLINFLAIFLGTYLFMLWMGIATGGNSGLFIFFGVLTIFFWNKRSINDIEYNRCSNCKNMNTVLDLGTEVTQETVEQEANGQFKVKGKKPKFFFNVYRRKRMCNVCEHEWSFVKVTFLK